MSNPWSSYHESRLGIRFQTDPRSDPAGRRPVSSFMSFVDRSEPFSRAIVRRSSTLETSSTGDEGLIGSSGIEFRPVRPFRSLVSYKHYYCSSSFPPQPEEIQ